MVIENVYTDLTYRGKPLFIDKSEVEQWYSRDGIKYINSGYRRSVSSMQNAYIMIIMDCSSSVGSEMGNAKCGIYEIVEAITEK